MRQPEELAILQEIASTGGASLSDSKGAYIGDGDGEIAKRLVKRNLIRKLSFKGFENSSEASSSSSGWFTLTDYARSFLKLAFCLKEPQKLLEFKRKGASFGKTADDLTAVELVQRLTAEGWKDVTTKKPSQVVPYSGGDGDGGMKIWYKKPGQSINIAYLRALACSASILMNNDSIHHFQPKAYYSALLLGCSALPGQPLAYYQKIMKDPKKAKSKATSRKRKAFADDAKTEQEDHGDIGSQAQPRLIQNFR